ncbi:MAG: UDP-N-acetylmuramate--L-alanine ligase [Bacteroidales bacterium]|jgi:UDP-N-acetylmuramate--alanine ligase|nr:UDP-N-acetylmuramate--L-alanine ligase [Bacteroidales bacterium]
MDLSKVNNIFFIGIGGIGMSALARYFKAQGKTISGYDRTCSELTKQLTKEGMSIFYEDDSDKIAKDIDLAIYTPAVPLDLNIFKEIAKRSIPLRKRADILGTITRGKEMIAIAGTHGKTTTSAILAHMFYQSAIGCTALIGGISNNYQTNFFSKGDGIFIVEADEYDRSLLFLHPTAAAINSMDADHLDIYGVEQSLQETYNEFANQIDKKGFLILHKGLESHIFTDVKILTVSIDNSHANYFADNIRIENGYYHFDLFMPDGVITNLVFGGHGAINVLNAVTASAIALNYGIDKGVIRDALENFSGVRRRFDFKIRTKEFALIDDYAHHPKEIESALLSVKELYPKKKITAIFQPHLYSRTRDFAEGFAKTLNIADEIILLDIYPARENPIAGISSSLIAEKITKEEVQIVSKEHLIEKLIDQAPEIVVMLGAGDIDRLAEPVENALRKFWNYNNDKPYQKELK